MTRQVTMERARAWYASDAYQESRPVTLPPRPGRVRRTGARGTGAEVRAWAVWLLI
ncbi:hypothetical protein [Streptomyces sp. NPDC090445]|uniref:hypothetical protein n=1 Tax=Streptomyces sp. NPDC090445 TaxID=3365963 RepID=UPI0037F3CA0E